MEGGAGGGSVEFGQEVVGREWASTSGGDEVGRGACDERGGENGVTKWEGEDKAWWSGLVELDLCVWN